MSGMGTFSGTDYQAAVIAYLSVHVLIGQRLGWLEFDDDTPIAVSAETGNAGDDAAVEFKAGLPTIEIQAKRGLDGAVFVETIERIANIPQKDWPAAIVLATDSTSSSWITSTLASDLDNRRAGRLDTARQRTRNLLDKLATPEQLAVLERLHVKQLDVDNLAHAQTKWATSSLANVLSDPSKATAAWKLLRDDASQMCKMRGRRTRKDLVKLLEVEAIKINPPAPIARIQSALDQSRSLLKKAQPSSALGLLSDIEKQNDFTTVDGGTHYWLLQQRGAAYLQLGRPQDALEFALRALDHDPAGFHALMTAALASMNLGETEKALQYAERATVAAPDDGDAWAVRAQVETSSGLPLPTPPARVQEAVTYRSGLVQVLLNLGRIDEAVANVDALLQEGQRSADLLLAKATALMSTSDHNIVVPSPAIAAEIERLTTEAIEERDPSDHARGGAYLARAMALRALSRPDEANADIQRAQDLHPNDPAPIVEGAQVLMNDYDFEGARRLLSRPVVEKFPLLIALRAEALAHLKDRDGAKRDIDEALRRLNDAYEPNSVRMAAADAAMELGDVDLAGRTLAAVSGPSAATARHAIVRGRLAFAKRDAAAMIEAFHDVAAREEKFRAAAYGELGSRLYAMKKYAEAVDAFRKSDPLPERLKEQYVRALGAANQIVDANGLIEEELQKGSRAPGWALELAAHIADARDDREAAVRHLSTLCARKTATPAARLRLASLLILLDRQPEARPIVEALVADGDELEPSEQMAVARAVFWLGDRERALDLAFAAYRRADGDADLQRGLASLALFTEFAPPVVDVVGPDTSVRLKNLSTGQERVYVVMSDEPINGALNQISVSGAQALHILGLKVGDEAPLNDVVTTWRVVELKSALQHIVQDIMAEYEHRFPDRPLFAKSFKVSEGLNDVMDFAPMIAILHQGDEHQKKLVHLFRKELFPLGVLTVSKDAPIDDVMAYLRSDEGGGGLFIEWRDSEGQLRSVENAVTYREIIVTESALDTAQRLGVLDAVANRFKVIAPNSLRTELRKRLGEAEKMVQRGHSLMSVGGPGLQMRQWPAGDPMLVSIRDRRKALVEWLEANATFEPRPLASIESVTGEDSGRNVMGASSFDSLALAIDRCVPVYADDLGLRRVGIADNVASFSTATLVIGLRQSGEMTPEAANAALMRLIELKYWVVPLSLDLLKEIVRSMEGTARLEAIATTLVPGSFTPQTAGRLAAQLLKWVATETVIGDSLADLTGVFLNAMARHWSKPICSAALIRGAMEEMSLLPMAYDMVKRVCVQFSKQEPTLPPVRQLRH